MKFLRTHIVIICAIITLIAVGGYEGYWILRLYHTERKSVESIIRASVTEADVEEYLARMKKGLGRQDSLFITSPLPAMKSKIVSMSLDSLSGNISEVNIYNIDKSSLPVTYGNDRPDVNKVQDLLQAYLDTAGLDIKCRLVYEGNEYGSILPSGTQDAAHQYTEGKVILTVPSNVNNGKYKVLSASLSGYIAGRISGVMTISAGILLIIILSFFMMNLTIKRRRRLEEIKNDFTQNITHELKTPIAVAYAASDTLLEYTLGENPVKRKKYLGIIKDQLDKLGGMVEMILSTTMENRSGLKLDYSATSVKSMLETAASQIKIKAEKQCDITVSVIPDNLEITIDRKLMSSVILTILDNALKYSGDSVNILVKASHNKGKTVISISDNGFGIAPSEQKHIFEKFYRVPTGNRHDVKGYGIGLFFAKSIVEKHGGKITVSSELGKGSSFMIEL
nr:HAMP domain-containing sensor histidine kinase [uncultured Bacteroides sp.]